MPKALAFLAAKDALPMLAAARLPAGQGPVTFGVFGAAALFLWAKGD